ncbi:hypothetical protein DVH24_035575 [Malus domestica]|uniref:Uncharacterized protein n=1 Tax=Malus domestica TaxID=3750 RepID=A0A498JBS5_MALDO|nr:hypothetical protein DVH24_035575 [Malus domestica]
MDAAIGRSGGAKYDCLVFDLDDTLYPLSYGLNLACRKNIEEFMLQQLQIEEGEVPRMCLDLYREYGTTMAGLKIFTNSDRAHAAQVLNRLGLEDCFEGIICFETLNPPHNLYDETEVLDCMSSTPTAADDLRTVLPKQALEAKATDLTVTSLIGPPKSPILCKPSVKATEAAIRIANVDPKKTIFFDDSARNIASGKAAGLHTVIVGSSVLVPGADHALSSIHNIKEALPEIWEGEEGQQLEQFMQSNTVETVVLA